MHANSRSVTSNQHDIHNQLTALVARHASTRWLKPVMPYNRAAFVQSMAAWRLAGAAPLIVDAGCGVGLSTFKLATQFPRHFIIGIDQSADRLARNITWAGVSPSNCIRVRADLGDYWRLMLEARIFPDRHYLLYPNPWPKKSHLARRWHGHAAFPAMVALGGHFECRSNWRIYIEECAAALTQLSGLQVVAETWTTDTPLTPFEEKYLASRQTLWRCSISLAASTSDIASLLPPVDDGKPAL
jgi:tRNA (guanine-N7-)-methyltransferase